MKILKTSSSNMKEESWKYGPVYSIHGNTFPIKNDLKRLGFSWSSFNRCWYISKNKVSSNPHNLINSLKALGVDVSSVFKDIPNSGINTPNTPIKPKDMKEIKDESKESKELSGEEYPINPSLYNEDKVRSRYSFPIEKNIYSFDLSLKIDGNDHIEPVTINRYYKKGKTSDAYKVTFNKEYSNYPVYEINVGNRILDNNPIKTFFGSSKMFNKSWGTYNEKDLIDNELIPLIKDRIEKNPSNFRIEYSYRDRTPELQEFLNSIESKYDTKKNLLYNIILGSDLYNGEFPISVHYTPPSSYNLSGEVTGYPFVDHNQAKRVGFSDILFNINLFNIHTKDDLESSISEFLRSNEVKEKYIKYLDSFPYADISFKDGFDSYSEISDILNNPSGSVDFVISKLREMGYIRVNKRKKGAEIPDSKKILNDFYSGRDVGSDFFYTFIAYQLHYNYKNYQTRAFYSFSYLFDIHKLYNVLSRFGDVDKSLVKSSVEELSEKCYSKLFGKREKNTWENYKDFYGRDKDRDEGRDKGRDNVSDNALYDLKEIADNNGIDTSDIETNALSIYRKLARLFHPDLNPDNPDANQMMQMVNGIWSSVPEKYKTRTAYTWYNMLVFSKIKI